MENLIRDLRHAGRSMRRSPGFTVVAVFTIALGIGATTAVFNLVNSLLLRPLPVEAPERLMVIEELGEDEFDSRTGFSYPYFRDYQEQNRVFSAMAAHGVDQLAFSTGQGAESIPTGVVTSNFFDVLGLRPAFGRFFASAEDGIGGQLGTVISHGLWKRRFGEDPAVIGQSIYLNSQLVRVIGVAPEAFTGLTIGEAPEAWVTLSLYSQLLPRSDIYTRGRRTWLSGFGRLRPTVTRAQAESALSGLATRIPAENPFMGEAGAVRLHQLSGIPVGSRSDITNYLALLLATAGLVLIIGSANVGGMLLARATSRRREMAVRSALGAGRGRLVRQLLTETLILFLIGGMAGIILALWLGEILSAWRTPLPFPMPASGLELRMLGFGLLISLAAGLIFGLAPALRASQSKLTPALNSVLGRGRTGSRLRSAFVVGQLALSLLLLTGAGLLVQALQSSLSIDPGFNAEGMLTAGIDLNPHNYELPEARAFYRQLLERVEAIPGVQSASLGAMAPLSMGSWTGVAVDGGPPNRDDPSVAMNVVDGDYFGTMQIPLLAGRSFSNVDRRENSPLVAVVNESMARRFWPGGEALGQRFTTWQGEVEIIGIVSDGKYLELREEARPFFYMAYAQNPWLAMTLHVRTRGEASDFAPLLRRQVQALDPNVPLMNVESLDRVIERSFAEQTVAATLVGIFGLVGLVLAAVGLYGVLAFVASQRTHEVGVRMALGARAGDVMRLMMRQGMFLVAAGVALGLAGAGALTRVLESFLFGVDPTDPATLFAVAALLTCVASIAAYLPARRATRVDPVVALRAE